MRNRSVYGDVAEGLQRMRELREDRDMLIIYKAFAQLYELHRIPPAIIDGMRDELLEMTCGMGRRAGENTFVYLTFFGGDLRASHMKVGVATDVERRVDSFRTGNPLTRLWTFSACFRSRRAAMKVETALLRHLVEQRISGEWVDVGGLSADAAASYVESLAEVARSVHGREVYFDRRSF